MSTVLRSGHEIPLVGVLLKIANGSAYHNCTTSFVNLTAARRSSWKRTIKALCWPVASFPISYTNHNSSTPATTPETASTLMARRRSWIAAQSEILRSRTGPKHAQPVRPPRVEVTPFEMITRLLEVERRRQNHPRYNHVLVACKDSGSSSVATQGRRAIRGLTIDIRRSAYCH